MSKQTEDEHYRRALEKADTIPAPSGPAGLEAQLDAALLDAAIADFSQANEDLVDGFSTISVGQVTYPIGDMHVGRIPALPQSSEDRKRTPLCTGLFDYFPAALAKVSQLSFDGNEKHNPGEPLHWSRAKSSDHADCILRHLLERGGKGSDGMRHSVCLVWRALALLQVELEAEGYEKSRGSK